MSRTSGDLPRYGEGRTHVGALLRDVFDRFVEEQFALFAAAGYDDLRPAHAAVFQHLKAEGSRVGELAQRARMTNQSMGYLVDALEARGYVERVPDPRDRRAAVVQATVRGRELLAVGRRAIADIERAWAREIGEDRMEVLLEALAELRPRP